MEWTDQRPATKRWTAADVWRMVEVGLLDEDDRYELIDGELLAVTPQGEDHAVVTSELMMFLVEHYRPQGYKVRCQAPIGGIDDWIPEPDLVVLAPLPAGQRTAPRPDQTLLVIEIAKTSHARDRRKSRVYAAHGAEQLWLVDLVRGEVLVHRVPLAAGEWGEVSVFGPGDRLHLPASEADLAVGRIMEWASG